MSEVILTVDTATPAGSVSISRGDTLVGEVLLNVKSTHTDRLLLTIRQLLSDVEMTLEQVDAFGVVSGPGSFTGLRVGVATVKGLALATGKPVVPVSALRAMAIACPFSSVPVCVMVDARKKEVYSALYRCQGELPVLLGEEAVLPPDALLAKLEGPVLFIGSGARVYRSLIVRHMGAQAHFVSWPLDLPRASNASVLALDGFRQGQLLPHQEIMPHYIRPSEAEIMWARKLEEAGIEG